VPSILLDSFRHNSWATRQLIEFCRPLTEEQLTTPGVGTFGGILATLNHIIKADGSYVRRLSGSEITWPEDAETVSFDQLDSWAAEAQTLWEQVLSQPIDTERTIVIDAGANETRSGIFFAQAINHANHHREQVCAILTGFGIQPPDIQAWEYAWHSGRIWERAQSPA
jgi:uncharacterized damage-inducible protein DinB